jgi:hypothetical protein
MKLESTLTKIAEQVFGATSVEQAKTIALEFLSESKINEADRKKMIAEIETKKDLVKLQIYIANALLKFEGLSLNDK